MFKIIKVFTYMHCILKFPWANKINEYSTCVQGSLDSVLLIDILSEEALFVYDLSNIILCQDMHIYKAYAKAKLILFFKY